MRVGERSNLARLSAPAASFQVGDWLIDPATRRFSRGDEARRVSPKAALVLKILAEARGAVVPREHLLDQVWPEVTVGEEVLTQAIAELRRAFNDSARRPRYIETVPKAGYRLLPMLQEATAETPEPREPDDTAPPSDEPAIFVLGREHKQVTVLDCAISDAAALAARLDAEAMADSIDHLHHIAREVIGRYDGTVAQWLGDGLVALFGAPRALEDHSRSAIGAARELMRRFEAESVPLFDGTEKLRLSVGIHTGPAVVGLREAGSQEIFTAIGVTTETAKQLRIAAPAGVLLASAETCNMVGSEIISSRFGLGEDSVKAFQVHAFTDRRSGVPRRGQPFLSKFVGRERELDMLLARIGSLSLSGGQIINVTGDPGIGKSRLTSELEATLADTEVKVLRAHCLPHGRSSPYLPLARLLQEICSKDSGAENRTLAERLSEKLGEVGLVQTETEPLLMQILGLPVDSSVADRLAAEQKQQLIFEGLHRLVAKAAERSPLVLLIEDLHWIDATSEAWLKEQTMRLTGKAMLMLVTHRPGYHAPWQSHSTATQIALPALDPADSSALIRSVPRKSALPPDALAGVVSRAQGNPFFLEELAFTYPGEAAGARSIPDTVQAVIAARIDRLPNLDKHLLQIAAVIGARIPLKLLEKVDRLDPSSRREALQRLQQTELLYQRHGAPDPIFAFKHALTQDVAYLGLVAKARRKLHLDIAEALKNDFPDLVDQRPEILARHLTEAGRAFEAVTHWHAAGRKAAAKATGVEAVAHYETAIELIDRQPSDNSLAEAKLTILIDLGAVLQNLKGAGAPAVGEVYRQAREISRGIAEAREGFVALWGLWHYTVMNARFQSSEDLADELLDLAGKDPDVELNFHAHHAIWTTARFTGSLAQAMAHTEAGMALADQSFHTASHYVFGGHDPICCARGTRAIVLGLQGALDSAVNEMTATIALAESLNHRPSLAGAYLNATDLYLAARDRPALKAVAAELRRLGEELGFAMHANIGRFSLAWCGFKESGEREALNEMRRVLDLTKRSGGTAREPYHYALFAECLSEAGLHNEARCVINEVFEEISERRQHHWAKSEAHRMLGEILLNAACGQDAFAEHHFLEARKIAAAQGALSLELRAACSQAKLWQRKGKAVPAGELLNGVYKRFTEGFDSVDLTYARGLIGLKSG